MYKTKKDIIASLVLLSVLLTCSLEFLHSHETHTDSNEHQCAVCLISSSYYSEISETDFDFTVNNSKRIFVTLSYSEKIEIFRSNLSDRAPPAL